MPLDAQMPTEMSGAGDDADAAPSSPMPGRPWGRYLIEKHLGGGGQADVFQAFDQVGMAGHVALKVPREPLQRDHIRGWVETEAGPITNLEHPNIVRVVDCGTVGAFPYVATELVTGLPLNEHVRANPPSLQRIHDWMMQLAEALDSAHSRGIVHRDIKPLNVIVTPEGTPRLIDFGLASFVTAYQPEPRRGPAGTYPFMAPEQARGDPNADHRVDVFALGGLLKYLLLREGPYHGVTSALRAAREGNVQLISDVSGSPLRRALCRIANRALSPDPDRRYQTMKDMGRALRSLRSRRKVLIGAAGLLALGVAVGLGLLAYKSWSGAGGSAERTDLAAADGPDAGAVLSVSFRRKDQTGAGRALTAEDLPLAAGDQIRIHAKFEQPLIAYVLAVSSGGGGVRVLYPPEGLEHRPVSEIHVPAAPDDWLEPDLPSGTLTVFLAARQEPLQAGTEILQRIVSAMPAPTIVGAGMLVFDGQRLDSRSSRAWQRTSGRGVLFNSGFLEAMADRRPGEWAVMRAIAFPMYSREGTRMERIRQRLPTRRAPDREAGRRPAPRTGAAPD